MTTVTTFESVDPATGEPVGTFPVHRRGRRAGRRGPGPAGGRWWAGLGFAGRGPSGCGAWRARLAGRLAELAELIHRGERQAGRRRDRSSWPPRSSTCDWAARNAERVLGPRRVRARPAGRPTTPATLEYQPYGVVGVIGPWNYPVFTPMGSIAYALAAGNAVVFKPREYTPAVGQWLVDSVRRGGARAAGAAGWSPALGDDRRGAVPVRGRQDRLHRLDRDRARRSWPPAPRR